MPILRAVGRGTMRNRDFCQQQFRMLYNGDRRVGVARWRWPIDAKFQRASSGTMEFPLQIPTSAPELDFVDFVASRTAVSLTLVAELAKIPEFSAAVSAYRSLLVLGYCGFFCWPAVHGRSWRLTEEQLLDHLRVAAYCNDLPAGDARRVDLDDTSAQRRFPVLFVIDDFPFGPNRSNYASTLLAAMGPFAGRHELRAASFSDVKKHDDDVYIRQCII
jgi:hypothetical protein